MTDPQELVRAFHTKFGLVIGRTPSVRDAEWYVRRLREEADEAIQAYEQGDLVAVGNELVDTIYVALGGAIACGVNIWPLFEAVHEANMLKVPDPLGGKLLKPPGWQSPVDRIKASLIAQFAKSLEE